MKIDILETVKDATGKILSQREYTDEISAAEFEELKQDCENTVAVQQMLDAYKEKHGC